MVGDERYIAGLFDGEGSINMSKGALGTFRPSVWIGMSHKETIERACLLLGGSIMHRPHSKISKSAKKDQYVLRFINQGEIVRVLNIILPYLITKREQALLMIEWCESRHGSRRRPYTDRDREIPKLISELNRNT